MAGEAYRGGGHAQRTHDVLDGQAVQDVQQEGLRSALDSPATSSWSRSVAPASSPLRRRSSWSAAVPAEAPARPDTSSISHPASHSNGGGLAFGPFA